MIGHVIFEALRRTPTGDVAEQVLPYETYGLYLIDYDAPPPKPKIYRVDVEGRSGTLDMTEWAGDVQYEDRQVKARFRDMAGRPGEFINAMLGRRCRIYFDSDDPDHYYMGRCENIGEKTRKHISDLTMDFVCHPWAYDAAETRPAFTGMAPEGYTTVTCTADNNGTDNGVLKLHQNVSYATITVTGYTGASGSTCKVTVNGTDYAISADGEMSDRPALHRGENSVTLTNTANGAALAASITYEDRVV